MQLQVKCMPRLLSCSCAWLTACEAAESMHTHDSSHCASAALASSVILLTSERTA